MRRAVPAWPADLIRLTRAWAASHAMRAGCAGWSHELTPSLLSDGPELGCWYARSRRIGGSAGFDTASPNRRQGRQGIRAPARPAGYVDGSSACQSSRFSRLSALRRPDAAVGAAISREAPPGLTRGVSSPYQELPVEVGNGFPTRLAPGYRGEVTNRPRLPDEVREVERSAKGSGDCIPARVTKARQPCRAFSRSGLGRLQPPARGRASICRVFSHVRCAAALRYACPGSACGDMPAPFPRVFFRGWVGLSRSGLEAGHHHQGPHRRQAGCVWQELASPTSKCVADWRQVRRPLPAQFCMGGGAIEGSASVKNAVAGSHLAARTSLSGIQGGQVTPALALSQDRSPASSMPALIWR
jgi:hypothetical protein